MEIEAKFRIPDEDTFQRLLAATSLAGFTLGELTTAELHDLYLDTAQRSLLSAGFTCRLRHLPDEGDRILVTLKGLGGAVGAVHRRVEVEAELPAPGQERGPAPGLDRGPALLAPADWPPGPARDLALEVCGSEPLTNLLEIEQTRHSRPVRKGDRTVAELGLDRVRVRREQTVVASYLVAEAELAPGGREKDLRKLAAELQEGWGLVPDGQSKFERALVQLGLDPAPEAEPDLKPHLTAAERAVVQSLVNERSVISRRARLLLAWDEGLSRQEMVARSGLSPRRARYWRRLFQQRRLGIFPARVLQTAAAEEAPPALGAEQRPSGVEVVAVPERQPSPPETIVLLKQPGIEPDDPMSEAGRKIFRFHLRRMLYHEPGARLGDDIEALHDMRVATRRMRAAFRVFGDHFEPAVVAPFLRGLRRTGQALGAVRDLDVFAEKVQAHQLTLTDSQRGSLDGFLDVLAAQRQAARDQMFTWLDSGKYRRFVEQFGEFVETPGLGSRSPAREGEEPQPYRTRHVAPIVVYERLAAVRAYDELVTLPNPPLPRLHALRIASKRLRYTLEFFLEVLGPEARSLIKEVVALQDHLGELQDAVVASAILRDFLVWGTWGPGTSSQRVPGPEAPVIAPGVASYLAVRQSELQALLAGFPAVWERVRGQDFSRMVAAAVAVL